NHAAETQSKCEGRDSKHPALASRTLRKRTAKAPCKKNSDGKAAHQATRMSSIVGSFGEMAEEQFKGYQEADPEQDSKDPASREIELSKRKERNQDSGLPKN